MDLIIAVAVLLAATLLYTLFVRAKDIPPPEPVSPTRHLDERKAIIYENLRDLQFEYRVGKLSDADYAQTKLALQKELATVIAATERVLKGEPEPAPNAAPTTAPTTAPIAARALALACPHCGSKFETPMKFCGACGKDMTVHQEVAG